MHAIWEDPRAIKSRQKFIFQMSIESIRGDSQLSCVAHCLHHRFEPTATKDQS